MHEVLNKYKFNGNSYAIFMLLNFKKKENRESKN